MNRWVISLLRRKQNPNFCNAIHVVHIRSFDVGSHLLDCRDTACVSWLFPHMCMGYQHLPLECSHTCVWAVSTCL